MITFVNKFTRPICYLKEDAYVVIDTETENTIVTQKQYYLYHRGKPTDRYKRYINLDYVDVCETEENDNLTEYGFVRINGNRWFRR
jgi:hypothetical protein